MGTRSWGFWDVLLLCEGICPSSALKLPWHPQALLSSMKLLDVLGDSSEGP